MKIAILLKRVPDTTSAIKIAASGVAIDEAGLKFIPNPYDEFAIEAALQLKEQHGGETVAISLGGDAVQETLRTALAMGVDRAVHLKGEGHADALAVAAVLADELRAQGCDLILAGKLAVDDAQHATGAMVAVHLGLACVAAVSALAVTGTALTAEREVEGGVELLAATLPALVTCDKGLNTPRIPKLQGIMAAKKKPLEIKPVSLAAPQVTVTALTLPPERKAGRIVGEGAAAVPVLVDLLKTEAKVLA